MTDEAIAKAVVGAAETQRSPEQRDADMNGAFACLLDHYLCCYDGSHDALARVAEFFLPDWLERASRFSPVDALRRCQVDREVVATEAKPA